MIRYFLIAAYLCPFWPDEPVNSKMLVSRLTDGYWQIWEVNLLNKRLKQLTRDAGDKRAPFLTPGGDIGFRTSNGRVYTFPEKGGEYRRLYNDIGVVNDLAWSPDKTWLAVSRLNERIADKIDITLLSSDGRTRRVLVSGKGVHYHAAWSPDGKQLAYSSGSGPGGHELYTIEIADGKPVRITNNDFDEFHPAWSPDGECIAYCSDQTGDYEIWLMRSNGRGVPKRLTRSRGLDDLPLWSHDGKEIVFTTNRNKKLELWIMSADGSDPRPLIQDDSEITGACWR